MHAADVQWEIVQFETQSLVNPYLTSFRMQMARVGIRARARALTCAKVQRQVRTNHPSDNGSERDGK